MHPAAMKYATLVGFLTGVLSPEVLVDEITAEVNACEAAFQAGEDGYFFITEGPPIEMTREVARRLLRAIENGRLPFQLANYVADCLELTDVYFEDDTVQEAFNFVKDDSRPPTNDETIEALAKLG